jgi:hypothetical protein
MNGGNAIAVTRRDLASAAEEESSPGKGFVEAAGQLEI